MTTFEFPTKSFRVTLLRSRLRSAIRIALTHFCISLLVCSSVAAWVFFVWFPYPFNELSHGRQLFFILMAVDTVCGPLLTLVLYDVAKEKYKWRIDMALVVCIQMLSLGYGLHSLMISRPLFLAFEGDRYRVVQFADVQTRDAVDAGFPLSWRGPRLLGVRLAKNTDPDFLASINLALSGLPPAFRPSRWVSYESMQPQIRESLRPLSELREKHPEAVANLSRELARRGLEERRVGYLPLVQGSIDDWVVVVDREDVRALSYFHLDGW